MKEILNVNFDSKDIKDENFLALYETRRRDSCFVFVYENDSGEILALRDHLGTLPLFYRFFKDEVKFSINFLDLILPSDQISEQGFLSYLSFGTVKLESLVSDIKVVNPGTVLMINKNDKSVKILYNFIFKRQKIKIKSSSKLVEGLDSLFNQAVKRIIKEKEVGLYLSGGMDSALVGIYLKKNGVRVNAYTSAPWGMEGTEVCFAQKNAEVIGTNNHFIIPFGTSKYNFYFNKILKYYRTPHGNTSSLGVISLFEESSMGKEKQVFGAQNIDTMTCSMFEQFSSIFVCIFPLFIKKKNIPSFYL